MNFERSNFAAVAPAAIAAAMALACGAGLTMRDAHALDAHAQEPQAGDCAGAAATSGEVARVVDGRSFLLADGREVRLAAIETLVPIPGDEDEARVAAALAAKAALESLVLHHQVDLRMLAASPDRYGRLMAYVLTATLPGEILVQRELVAGGHALVAPASSAARCRTYLHNAERGARAAKLGLWSDPYYVVKQATDAADVLAEQGQFSVVEGRVTSVRESGGLIYVNFGRRRSDQLTVTILKRNEGIFASAGLTPKALAGRSIEVRGWIEERGGPAMEVMRPEQIEIVH